MSNIENLEDHMAFSCKCGCVRFNLLKSGGIECDDCGGKVTDSLWGQAIAEAEKHEVYQEPVAWMYEVNHAHTVLDLFEPPDDAYDEGTLHPLYTHPQPKREWVELTNEEIDQGLLRSDYALQNAHAWRAGVVFAMTQLKEKNT